MTLTIVDGQLVKKATAMEAGAKEAHRAAVSLAYLHRTNHQNQQNNHLQVPTRTPRKREPAEIIDLSENHESKRLKNTAESSPSLTLRSLLVHGVRSDGALSASRRMRKKLRDTERVLFLLEQCYNQKSADGSEERNEQIELLSRQIHSAEKAFRKQALSRLFGSGH